MEFGFEGQVQGNEGVEAAGWEEFMGELPILGEEEWFATAPTWNEGRTTNGDRICMLCLALPGVELRGSDRRRKRRQ